MDEKRHVIAIDGSISAPEEGLLFGNGELSVSLYQSADRIVWRFGKTDVWDRRHDTSEDPVPAHIDEIVRGIRDEGWVNDSFERGNVQSRRSPTDETRMREICSGTPSYAFRPYPCPKPVGELSMRLPADLQGLVLTQRLTIEENIARLSCVWPSGLRLAVECFIPPRDNVLTVTWKLQGADPNTQIGRRSIGLALYRWADPDPFDFACDWRARCGNEHFMRSATPEAVPLPPPVVEAFGDAPAVLQRFHPDPTSPSGFSCAVLPVADGCRIEQVNGDWAGEARLNILPGEEAIEGELAVLVATGDEPSQVGDACASFASSTVGATAPRIAAWRSETLAAGEEFWSRSAVRSGDELFEQAWYETLHARRATFRHDAIAPGLFLPSTVNDYSYWHGDYHHNYNYQSPFWGDYAANQLTLGDSYFPGMKHVFELGRKLARDYWGARGSFVQLSSYPFPLQDDPLGVGSLCRMAYMTGWATNHYWSRYLYTRDREWLRETGYPVLRDAALFYADFLTRFDDGFYHAFPSGEGEYHYTGNPEDYTDKPQVVRHARYCLQSALKAALVLGVDENLQDEWREILDNLVVVDDLEALGLDREDRRRYPLNPPEFSGWEGDKVVRGDGPPRFLQQEKENPQWSWYFGHLPWIWMGEIRCGSFDGDRDYATVRDFMERWRLPNGLYRAMCQELYGYAGGWSESMGILAPLQEMLLQSWDGSIRIFPAWPKDIDASFSTLRAEGAFLVSSELKDGWISRIAIQSEKGLPCRLENPWDGAVEVLDGQGAAVECEMEDGVIVFATVTGDEYEVRPR